MRVLAIEEIAIVAGLPLARVIAISQQTGWDDITIAEAERFVKACGFDPFNSADRNRKGAYFHACKKKPPSHRFQYLQTDARWTTEFLPLIKRLQSTQSLPSRTGFSTSPPSA